MPTLYVENVPKDLYEALRARARKNRNSIAAEVIEMLKTRAYRSRTQATPSIL